MPRRQGNPQLEDGHTRIANELFEALLRYPFSGGELKVVLAIIRLTYGWQRTQRVIRQREVARLTRISLRQVKRLLRTLRDQGVLFRDRHSLPHTFQLNKGYYGWKHWGTTLSPEGDTHVPSAGDTGVPPYKEKKEIIIKQRRIDPSVQNFCQHFSQFLRRPLTPKEVELISRLHELSPEEVQRLLEQAMAQTGQGNGIAKPEECSV